MTTTLKNCISLYNLQSQNQLNTAWSSKDEISTGRHFNFSVPLKNLLGFAEDSKKVLLKCKHELVLMLNTNLGDVFEQSRNEHTFKLEMTNIDWKILHVAIIKSGVSLPIAFRSGDSYVNPKLGYGSRHSWNVKLSANREKTNNSNNWTYTCNELILLSDRYFLFSLVFGWLLCV